MKNGTENRQRIVVLGGGFGGAYAAQQLEKKLAKSGHEIVLIDRQNFILFTPLLVEAGTGRLEPRHAVVPIRSFVKKARFIMGEIVDVDETSQEVLYRLGGSGTPRRLHYDHAVLSLGSVTKMPGVPGLKEHAFEMKSIGDCVALRDRAIQMLEMANTIEDEVERHRLLHFVFVGGSYTGVEAAGEFQAFLTEATHQYRNLSPADINVTLVEMQERILPTLDEGLASYALENLRSRNVDVRLSTTVNKVEPESVTLSDDSKVHARTVVWCAGISPNPLLKKLSFDTDERGYLLCDRDLRLKGHQNIWAIGDCAVNVDEDGNPYPPTAQHATRQGKHLARNIAAVLGGKDTTACNVSSPGTLAAFGCYRAVAKVYGFRVTGFLAWFLWRTVYLLKMPTWKRRVRLALDWTADLLLRRDIVQLGVHRLHLPPEEKAVPAPTVQEERESKPEDSRERKLAGAR